MIHLARGNMSSNPLAKPSLLQHYQLILQMVTVVSSMLFCLEHRLVLVAVTFQTTCTTVGRILMFVQRSRMNAPSSFRRICFLCWQMVQLLLQFRYLMFILGHRTELFWRSCMNQVRYMLHWEPCFVLWRFYRLFGRANFTRTGAGEFLRIFCIFSKAMNAMRNWLRSRKALN